MNVRPDPKATKPPSKSEIVYDGSATVELDNADSPHQGSAP